MDQTTGDVMTEPSSRSVTFVFVPGAGGQAWYWHRIMAELEARGHTAIAVDLPASDDTADLDVYADTIAEAATERDGVVMVAQSMGGFSAPHWRPNACRCRCLCWSTR